MCEFVVFVNYFVSKSSNNCIEVPSRFKSLEEYCWNVSCSQFHSLFYNLWNLCRQSLILFYQTCFWPLIKHLTRYSYLVSLRKETFYKITKSLRQNLFSYFLYFLYTKETISFANIFKWLYLLRAYVHRQAGIRIKRTHRKWTTLETSRTFSLLLLLLLDS